MRTFEQWLMVEGPKQVQSQLKFIGFPDGHVVYGEDERKTHDDIWHSEGMAYAKQHFPELLQYDIQYDRVLRGSIGLGVVSVYDSPYNHKFIPLVLRTLVKDGYIDPERGGVMTFSTGELEPVKKYLSGSQTTAPTVTNTPEETEKKRTFDQVRKVFGSEDAYQQFLARMQKNKEEREAEFAKKELDRILNWQIPVTPVNTYSLITNPYVNYLLDAIGRGIGKLQTFRKKKH